MGQAIHVFKGNVHHDKKKFVKGQECPAELLEVMKAKKLVEVLPEAIKPVPAPQDDVGRPRTQPGPAKKEA